MNDKIVVRQAIHQCENAVELILYSKINFIVIFM